MYEMLPFIIGGIAVAAAVTAGTTIYKKFSSDEDEIESLGSFAIWGRPDSGKTTFVYRIQQKNIPEEKEATTSKQPPVTDIKPFTINGKKFKINEITDLPGTVDRQRIWKTLVSEKKHIFYLVNLSRLSDAKYLSNVKHDLQLTAKTIGDLKSGIKPIHIIGTHIDESEFKDLEDSQVGNVLQQNSKIRAIHESIQHSSDKFKNSEEMKGFLYPVNLMDELSFKILIESIINDIK